MSLALRIIPRLDIKGPNLVKGIHLEGLRVLGKPEHFAKYYYEQGADELFYQDVVASLYGRNSLHDIVSKTAKEIFIPLTVGGGIRNVENIASILRVGADKVSMNTAVISNPALISEASNMFGASTIVVSIEAIRQPDGRYMAFTDNGRNITNREVISWAKHVEQLGAGEILITFVDNEGSGKGLDIDLARKVSGAVSIPVVVHGGVGQMKHVLDLCGFPCCCSTCFCVFLVVQYLSSVSVFPPGVGGWGCVCIWISWMCLRSCSLCFLLFLGFLLCVCVCVFGIIGFSWISLSS